MTGYPLSLCFVRICGQEEPGHSPRKLRFIPNASSKAASVAGYAAVTAYAANARRTAAASICSA
jgi:hypothetical protein